MAIKRTLSVILSIAVMLTVVCGCFVVSANAAGTVTYSFVIKTSQTINAFEGKIHYPQNAMSVNSITFSGTKHDKGGIILFNDSNIDPGFDFSEGANIITVEFAVNGEYDSSQIYGEIEEFYNISIITDGNIPFDYSNVIDGEVVSCGHTDIDNPSDSYANTKYSIVYSYRNNPTAENPTTYTKYAWSNLTNAKTIAELNMPRINNPYYKSYSVETASFTYTGSKVINASLSCEDKMYDVKLNGISTGQQYKYLQPANVTTAGNKYFVINGVCVAWGSSYTFFVTGNMDITAEDNESSSSEKSASVVTNALYLSDNDLNSANIKMEMLVSATTDGFKRMGIAFASTKRSSYDVSAAINAVTGTDTAVSNKIAVHNSLVDNPNVSGQYQFIYAPYVTVSKVNKDKSMYFYAFVVNTDGTVTISAPAQIAFANVLA